MPEITGKIEEIIRQYANLSRDVLIPILQQLQDEYGYISKDAVLILSRRFGLPASKIYGVATFYNQFRFIPRGRFHIQVCNGSSCHLSSSKKIINELERELGIKDGEVTRDKMFSLEVVPCIGACGQSPVISVNNEYHNKLTINKLKEILQMYREKETENKVK